jgi:two-component sensor histidine kinase
MVELDIAKGLIRTLTKAKDEDDLLSELAAELLRESGGGAVDIMLREAGDGLVLRASTASPEFIHRLKLGKGVGLCGQVYASGKPKFITQKAPQEPQYASYPGVEGRESEALAIYPLYDPQGQIAGIVEFGKGTPWAMSPKLKRELAARVELAAELFFAYRGAFQSATLVNRLGALSEVSKTIATSPYVEEILQLLVNLTAQQFNYRVCTVRLLDEDRQELVLRATQAPAKAYQRKRAIKLGESIAGKTIVEKRPIIVQDVQLEADYIGHDLAVEQGLRSMICVPLTIQDRAVGVLSCYTSEIHTFGSDEIKALETLAKQAAVSIEHAKLQVRNTLMQEMHHRVKNNLQQIASLLRLQMRHSEYKSLEEALNDVLSRILAIASVHDLLSREDLDHVGLRSIAETLVQHQQSSLVLPDKRIAFQVRGEDVHLNMTQATQIALVLNELILNAVEHGFEKASAGEIHVNVEEKDGEVGIWVSDSGDKLPPNFDLAAGSHLGLQIVESLVRALGGRFSLKDVFGWTVAEVKFGRSRAE